MDYQSTVRGTVEVKDSRIWITKRKCQPNRKLVPLTTKGGSVVFALSHETSGCPTALIKTPDERWDMLMKRKGALTCFNCLQPGSISHNSRTCKAPRCSVGGCGRKHHYLLHVPEKSKPNEEDTQSLPGLVSTNKQNLLPTASARLIYGDKECSVRVLLDTGSQETFLRTTIANDLKIKPYGSQATMTIKVLGGQEQRKKTS